jgi:hypothetical protein
MHPEQDKESRLMKEKTRWSLVLLYAAAMAWVEAAVVMYLRTMIDRVEPYQIDPLPVSAGLGEIELIREGATLIMLLCVGWLAGKTWRSRMAYVLIAFGAWDILYYVFLNIMGGWPNTLLDWDILFLLPLPWWGPVLAPMMIALLMILGGTLVTRLDQHEAARWPGGTAWSFAAGGVLLALVVFMLDSLQALMQFVLEPELNHAQAMDTLRTILPVTFQWPMFILALLFMFTPIIQLARNLWQSGRKVVVHKERI